jgi:hypothetical protein
MTADNRPLFGIDQSGFQYREMARRNPMKGRRAPGSAPPRVVVRMFLDGSPKCPPRITHSASASRFFPSSDGS